MLHHEAGGFRICEEFREAPGPAGATAVGDHGPPTVFQRPVQVVKGWLAAFRREEPHDVAGGYDEVEVGFGDFVGA